MHESMHRMTRTGSTKTSFAIVPAAWLLVALSACAPTTRWVAEPEMQAVETSIYDAVLQPLQNDRGIYVAFSLTVTNKTAQELVIDWNESRYLHNDRASGVFVFAGISPEMVRDQALPADTIAPGDTLLKRIAPHRLIAFAPMTRKGVGISAEGIAAGKIPAGENGILLVARQWEKIFRKAITVEIIAAEQTD